MKLIFGTKNSTTLFEVTKVIQKEGELAKTFNEFFVSIVKNLRINENLLPISSSETKNVESIIAKFEYHPSIVTIRNRFDKNNISSFKKIVKTEVIKIFPLREFGGLSAVFITENFNLYLNKGDSFKRIWWFIRSFYYRKF